MKNLIFIIIIAIAFSSCKKEEINPSNVVNQKYIPTYSGEKIVFGYELFANGNKFSKKDTFETASTKPCIPEAQFNIIGDTILAFINFVSDSSLIKNFNKKQVHYLTQGYQEWYNTPLFSSSLYFKQKNVTNSSFEIEEISFIREINVRGVVYKYYYTVINLEWGCEGVNYNCKLYTAITIQ